MTYRISRREVDQNFIAVITFAILSDSEFSTTKWLIYVPRLCGILRTMNQTNGTSDLDRHKVICLFIRVSISRESCAKADFRLSETTLEHVARYRHILHARSTSFSVFVRLAAESGVRSNANRFRSFNYHRISGEDFPRESNVWARPWTIACLYN